jgi:hypothetical protein
VFRDKEEGRSIWGCGRTNASRGFIGVEEFSQFGVVVLRQQNDFLGRNWRCIWFEIDGVVKARSEGGKLIEFLGFEDISEIFKPYGQIV